MRITSLQNSRIKNVVKLFNSQRHRDQQKKLVIEGYRSILRAVENHYPLDELYICPELFIGTNEPRLIQEAAEAGAQVIEVTADPFRKMTSRQRPEGLLAVAPQIRKRLEEHLAAANGFYIIAESIEKPGNLGSLLRSADGAGVDGVIVCDSQTDISHPEVIQASVGTFFCMPILEGTSRQALAWCHRNGIRTVAATPHTDHLYTQADLVQPVAIVVGTEQYGLSQIWLEQADLHVRLPMYGRADSLNVTVAATVLLYEVVRQRRLVVREETEKVENRGEA